MSRLLVLYIQEKLWNSIFVNIVGAVNSWSTGLGLNSDWIAANRRGPLTFGVLI